MHDEKAKFELLDRITARGVEALIKEMPDLDDAKVAAIREDKEIGMQFMKDVMFDKGVPHTAILHRLTETTIKETLLEAIQTEEQLDRLAAANDEIDETLDIIAEEPKEDTVAFYRKKVDELGKPKEYVDPLQMAIDAENERDEPSM